jgi:sortase A
MAIVWAPDWARFTNASEAEPGINTPPEVLRATRTAASQGRWRQMRSLAARQKLFRWAQRILFAGGVSMAAYCAFIVTEAWIFQKVATSQLEKLLTATQKANAGIYQNTYPASLDNSPAAVTGSIIGRIEISRLGLSAIVIEGTSEANLRRAAGHIAGTALPGRPGNVVISGHRDTFFRPLRNVLENDVIMLTTISGEYRYRVVSIRVVSPYDVAVLDRSQSEILTLVTCYPFYFVGSAPGRFIVRAERTI